MALLKKISYQWEPSEKRDLKVGEIFDFPGEPSRLLRDRMAVLVDENGKELPMPGTVFTCAICFAETHTLDEYTTHVLSHASQSAAQQPVEQPTPEVKAEVDAIKDKKKAFAERMAKGRAIAKAKKEAAKSA